MNLATGVARAVATGPDWLTGGAAGPEASVACLALYALLVIVLLRRAKSVMRERFGRFAPK